MPVVDLQLDRLVKLLDNKITKDEIIQSLPFLGLDIESQSDKEIRIEYSPNRPDYATESGIILGLEGLLNVKKGIINLEIESSKEYEIQVTESILKERPFITGIVATGSSIDDFGIKQIVNMQEDLHLGLGRRRTKSSIGIHDLDRIEFPLKYTTTTREHKFVPLYSESSHTIDQILKEFKVGQDYGHLVHEQVPIILDKNSQTVSVPPIINAAKTTVTENTKNLFVEVTGLNEKTGNDILSVICLTLHNMGFKLKQVNMSGAIDDVFVFDKKTIQIEDSIINKTIGLDLSSDEIISSLEKCRLDAVHKDDNIICTIPRYRFDIIGPMDIVEEVVLGHGINKLEPSFSPSSVIGQKNELQNKTNTLRYIMIGLGYTEALNFSLTSSLETDTKQVKLLNSKNTEHTVLRDSLIVDLIRNLGKNIHKTYPQKIFETGQVFLNNNIEQGRLCCLYADKNADYAEVKSILETLLLDGGNKKCFTPRTTHPLFEDGKVAKILVDDNNIGVIGQISLKILERFKIRVPIVGFEIAHESLFR